MYYYYQQNGGEEEWVAIKAIPYEEIEAVRPTFVTVLALSHLITPDMKREDLAKVKYEGPLYFDFDAADVMESVEGVKELWAKMKKLDLEESDVKLYLSGKKGLHLLVPPVVFMEKPGAVLNLPAIYKEMAFMLAVDTMDFRVYTARRGRQFRTVYNVRENGNYKVAITFEELASIDSAEAYNELCKSYRPVVSGHMPKWRAKLGLMYDTALQKVGRVKAKPTKATPPAILAEQLPQFTKLANGTQPTDKGFNIVGMQLALYAREMQWDEEYFINACSGIIQNHQSDGSRYNTPSRRERELRRMFNYIAENAAFEYSIGGIRSCFAREVYSAEEGEAEGEVDTPDFAGVYAGRSSYMAAKGDDGDTPVSNFVFRNIKILRSLENDAILSIEAAMVMRKGVTRTVTLIPASFTGGSALQNAVASFGGSFSGTDIHARGVYQAMLKEVEEDQYVLDSEGINLFQIGRGTTAKREYVVWADREGVRSAVDLKEEGFSVGFQGFPDARGVIRTDLLAAPSLSELCSTEVGVTRFADAIEALCHAHTPEVMGKMLGWAAASFYAPLFQQRHKKFPLLHVYGPAGNGKSLSLGTPILMADGTTKAVENIVNGDRVLSPYGGYRTVGGVHRGRERMWKVTPVKGDSYVCNESHILSLKRSNKDGVHLRDGTYVPGSQEILNINVKDYYENPKVQRQFKGWRLENPVEFVREYEELELDPYFLGFWLGDGSSHNPAISKPDCLGVQKCFAYAKTLGCEVTHHNSAKWGRCDSWAFTKGSNSVNPITAGLRRLGVLQERQENGSKKFVPEHYKLGSVETRKQLLAGLLDSDGALNCGGFDYVSKHKHIADDVAFICRSLGLAAYVSECRKGVKSTGFEGTYWRVIISGDCTVIPTLDKRAPERRQSKRVTVTGITVEPLEEGDYYGFTLDGDHLFMLGDFTVTHNTETVRGLLGMFFHREPPAETSPNSSVFALQMLVAGSASIPVLLDEYKPHAMQKEKLDQYRAVMRDIYNAKSVQRGGGSRTNAANFSALSTIKLQAPVVFVGEAPETETAIVERSVMVSFKRLTGRAQSRCYTNALKFYADPEPLSSLGLEIATGVVATNSAEESLRLFDDALAWSSAKFLPAADDADKVAAGEMTTEEMRIRSIMRPRTVFNSTVSFFGLQIIKRILIARLGKEAYDERFGTIFTAMSKSCFMGMEALAAATLPEFIKVLTVFSDMSKLDPQDPHALVEGVDYNMAEYAGRAVIVVAAAQAYRKYRTYMKNSGTIPLYPSEEAFTIAMREIPQFIKMSEGTARLQASTMVLSAEELHRAGVPFWKGKSVSLEV